MSKKNNIKVLLFAVGFSAIWVSFFVLYWPMWFRPDWPWPMWLDWVLMFINNRIWVALLTPIIATIAFGLWVCREQVRTRGKIVILKVFLYQCYGVLQCLAMF